MHSWPTKDTANADQIVTKTQTHVRDTQGYLNVRKSAGTLAAEMWSTNHTSTIRSLRLRIHVR
jgi:hypothetical protein